MQRSAGGGAGTAFAAASVDAGRRWRSRGRSPGSTFDAGRGAAAVLPGCGSSLFWERIGAAGASTCSPATLDAPTGLALEGHIFVADKGDYYAIGDGCRSIRRARTMIFTVAIDGPAAAGKGTIGRAVAARFGFAHLDTGLLYRAVGVQALARRARRHRPALVGGAGAAAGAGGPRRATTCASARAGQAASKVAALPEVRAALLDFQRASPGATAARCSTGATSAR